jgi:hypothetical protein
MSSQPKVGELVAKAIELGMEEDAAKKLIKDKAIRSYSKLTTMIEESKKPKNIKVRKAAVLRQEGPRGFKVGPVWIASIKAGKGVALKPSNLPKLKKTAEEYKVTVKDDATHEEIVAAIAAAL